MAVERHDVLPIADHRMAGEWESSRGVHLSFIGGSDTYLDVLQYNSGTIHFNMEQFDAIRFNVLTILCDLMRYESI